VAGAVPIASGWGSPRLRADAEQRAERTASWPELVYDLVFVVAIAALTARLEGEIGWRDVVRVGLLLTPVWWVWMGVALALDRFDGGPIALPLTTLLNLLPAAALALTVGEATGARSTGFVLAYVAARAVPIGLWLRVGRRDPVVRPLAFRLAAGFSLAVAPWVISLAVPTPARFALWALGLAIDLVTPLTTRAIQASLPRLSASHLSERYRVFAIIVLGEAVAGAVRAVGEGERLPLLSGALALTLAFAVGWTLFAGPMREHASTNAPPMAAGYLLLPLVGGLTALGAGIVDVIVAGDAPADSTRWLLGGSIALTLATVGALELLEASPTGRFRLPALRLGAAVAAALTAALGGGLAAAPLLVILTLIVASQTLLGVVATGVPATAVDALNPKSAAEPSI
jgi:low temperature requirement protein LtrA